MRSALAIIFALHVSVVAARAQPIAYPTTRGLVVLTDGVVSIETPAAPLPVAGPIERSPYVGMEALSLRWDVGLQNLRHRAVASRDGGGRAVVPVGVRGRVFADGVECGTWLGLVADQNLDGFVDGIDYTVFVSAWIRGEVVADCNDDGFVDALDYDTFVGAWLGTSGMRLPGGGQ